MNSYQKMKAFEIEDIVAWWDLVDDVVWMK